MGQSWLTEVPFSGHEPHLPMGTRGGPRVDDCRAIGGILHILRFGVRWIDAALDYRPRKALP